MTEHSEESAAVPMRTMDIDYSGPGDMEDVFDAVFDAVVEVFERHGLKVEGASDVPFDHHLVDRLDRAEAENERLRELLYQALTEGGFEPADYGVSLNHDTGQALLFGSSGGER